ncbi:MAG: enoyl-CoA hydratase/isomerase family protein [Thermodesulfobacteriota bacterium]
MPELKYFQVEIDGPIIIWKFYNPPQNLMNIEAMEELGAQVDAFDQNPDLRVGIYTSATPGLFVQHFDVSLLLEWGQGLSLLSKEEADQQLALLPPPQGLSQRTSKPLICAINGPVEGGGCELALDCDFRFIARDCFMAQPEVYLGFPPGGGGTQRLARLLGPAKALELCLTGRRIYGDEAERLGIVTQACNPDELITVVKAFAMELATKPPGGVAVIKKAIYEGLDNSLSDGLLLERKLFFECLRNSEALELMKIYVETGQDREKAMEKLQEMMGEKK